jgi:sterol desaturase/sphingolipid hydroxylase (fatty acid hydroxylase superfamily)
MAGSKRSWMGGLAAGGIVIGLFLLERRYPLRPAKPEPDRKRVPRNAAVAAVTAAVVAACERPLVEPLARRVDRRGIGMLPALGLSPAAEKLLGVVLLDYSLYWWHVLLHRIPFLWRSHLVHHTDLVLDTTTALRVHWLEFLASVPWRVAQVGILGIRPSTLSLWQRLTLLEVFFHHSNLRLPIALDRQVRRFVVTPRMHGIHHSVIREERDANFSSGLTIWDRLHRTMKTDVAQEDIEIGVCTYHSPEELRLPHLMTLPFERQRSA